MTDQTGGTFLKISPRLLVAGLAALVVIAGVLVVSLRWRAGVESPSDSPAPRVEIRLPMGPPLPDELKVTRIEKEFPRNSNLRDVLVPYGFTPQDIHQLIEQTRDVHNLNRVTAGHRYAIDLSANGRFREFEYDLDESRYMVVRPTVDGYEAEIEQRIFKTSVVELAGRIQDNLWNSIVEQGESGQLAMSMHELLQWDIDFTAIQPDDSFRALLEKQYYEGDFVRYGAILALEFNHGGRSFYAFRFEDGGPGQAHYFDSDGKSVKKAFLKVPFKYDYRISSGFSASRLHPVLGTRRAHYGIDFAAPSGTPVLASASGRVIFAGWKGANGNLIELRHPNGYRTYYLHLSKILVKAGQSVSQGDRIGLVGQTGLASGPHLDYRVQDRSGRFLNPKKWVALPSDKSVSPERMKEFIAVRDGLLRQLERVPIDEESPAGVAVAG
ncbi:MAG: peptidoglycan DD-metalloendopeptidase family protein [Acidobacteriota bacterium]